MVKALKLKNRGTEIKFCGNIQDGEIEVEIEDDMRDLFAYTYLTKQDLIDIKEHVDKVLQEM
tara:strand:+ start:274 stop:459 length:186 start_codon:yes stop_codon:yes gene_type:complete